MLFRTPISTRRRRRAKHEKLIHVPPLLVGVLMALTAVLHALEVDARKVLATALYNYRWFAVQLTALLVLVFSGIVSATRWGQVRADMAEATLRPLVLIGFLDCLAANLLFIPLTSLPGLTAVAVPLMFLPLRRFVSLLCHRHDQALEPNDVGRWCSRVGCLTVMGGAMLAIVPEGSHFHSCAEGVRRPEFVSAVVFCALSLLPAVASQESKDSYLSRFRMEPAWFSCVVALFQLFFGLLLSPLFLQLQYAHAAPDTRPHHSLAYYHVFSNFAHGFDCLFGVDSLVGDECERHHTLILASFAVYMFGAALFQASSFLLIERADTHYRLSTALNGAAFFAILFFLIPPLSQPCLPDGPRDFCGPYVTWYRAVGALLCVLGLIVASYDQPPPPDTVDVWACIEEEEAAAAAEGRKPSRPQLDSAVSARPQPDYGAKRPAALRQAYKQAHGAEGSEEALVPENPLAEPLLAPQQRSDAAGARP